MKLTTTYKTSIRYITSLIQSLSILRVLRKSFSTNTSIKEHLLKQCVAPFSEKLREFNSYY